jgi:hypothetical protein
MSNRIIDSRSIDRRTPDVAVVGRQLFVQVGKRQRHETVDPTQQVALGDATFQPERVKQTTLIAPLSSDHRPPTAADDQSAIGITVRRYSQALFRQHRP